MIEMRGADAYFLWEESRALHMHTLKIIVVQPGDAHHPITFERVREGAPQVLPRFAAFRQRPVEIPLGLGHPLWIDTPRLDRDYHLRREVLPKGAGDEELDKLAGRIASEPLRRDRPLWQIFFVEGLPGGRVAYVTKLHHALADGLAAAELVLRTFQDSPGPTSIPADAPAENEAVPGVWSRLVGSMGRALVRQRALPQLLLRSARAVGVSARWQMQGRPSPTRPFVSPATRFNRPVTPNRVYAHVTLPLADLRQVKSAFRCTINDVYLALVGGALRRYLEEHRELPDAPLTAAVPVSVRRKGDAPDFGNATATWFASTGSDCADPLERLHAVTKSTRAARARFEAGDPHLAVEWLDHWPLRRIYLDGLQRVARSVVGRPSYNVIVSNVRGPARPLYTDGARVVGLYSMGPLSLQQGLNFTAWSYLEDFAVGIHACREHVPDVRALAAGLESELQVLRGEAERKRAGAA